ncbi:MAG: hypothetical protein WCO58_00100 [bacterium]
MKIFLKKSAKNLTRNAYKGDVMAVFLLIIGIVLFATMAGYFKTHTISLFSGFGTTQSTTTTTKKNNNINSGLSQEELDRASRYNQSSCGLVITDPYLGAPVSFPLNFAGYASGCEWGSLNNTVGEIQVFDGNGRPLSAPYDLASTSGSGTNEYAYFSQSLTTFRIPDTTAGYLIIKSAVSGNTIQIPIAFQ